MKHTLKLISSCVCHILGPPVAEGHASSQGANGLQVERRPPTSHHQTDKGGITRNSERQAFIIGITVDSRIDRQEDLIFFQVVDLKIILNRLTVEENLFCTTALGINPGGSVFNKYIKNFYIERSTS